MLQTSSSFRPQPSPSVEFGGEVARRVFERQLNNMPEASKARLDEIDKIPEHNPEHIKLAVQLGKDDPYIDQLNQLIIGLVTETMGMRKRGETLEGSEAGTMLGDLRYAIDKVLDAFRSGPSDDNA